MIGLLGNIPSFKVLAVRVAAKCVSKVNTADNFAHMPLDNLFLLSSYVPVLFFDG